MRARRTPPTLRKLLVVDDDAKLLTSYRDLLIPYGFEVLAAENGKKAVALVEEHPDIMLVILDVRMPVMDGREWLRWYRGLRGDSPVIVISAYSFEPEPKCEPSAMLAKPFHVAELLDLVGLFCGLGTPGVSAGV